MAIISLDWSDMVYDVLALGDYSLDLIFADLERAPALGKEVYGRKFSMLPGGTYNTAAALHRLGVNVAWAANFGNDEFSQFVLKAASEEGLTPVCFSLKDKPYRNITVAASYKTERAFISYSDPQIINPVYLRRIFTTPCRILFISGLYTGQIFTLGASLIRSRKMLLVMDGNSSAGTLADQKIVRSLKAVDIFMPNAREARRLVGSDKLEDCLKDLGSLINLVVIKDGRNGAYAIQNGQITHVPGIPVKCLDTTGAGDCFDAGFLKAYLDNNDLETCLKWGNIVGGLSTQGFGGSGFIVYIEDVKKTLKKCYKG
ncbi:MAG: carbohydrate kinase family protein [Anaerolineaceae bacterium]